MAALSFAGHAALFDVIDRGGDIIRRGAFAAARPPVPLLWQHDPARVIGRIDMLREDALGLAVAGTIDGRPGTADSVLALLRERQIDGLSFGYRVRASRPGPPGRNGRPSRELLSVEIVEISIVAQPMQPAARIRHLTDISAGRSPASMAA